jgi:uncharacterized protein YgiM (DUF1202 family)
MAENLSPKKVFISATFKDLREYRQAAARAINQFPGWEVMKNETMDASPDEPITAMNKLIAQCDIFIGIYAYRYGFIPEGDNYSYIEQEYRYARSTKKPMFCFIVDRSQSWPPSMFEEDPSLLDKMNRFKEMVLKEHVAGFFTTPEDLAERVNEALQKYLADLPRPAEVNVRVTATNGLRVRSGPGTTYTMVGMFPENEVVTVIGRTEDGSWLQVRRESDGMTGWCSSEYLIDANATPQSIPKPPPVEKAAGRQKRPQAKKKEEENQPAQVPVVPEEKTTPRAGSPKKRRSSKTVPDLPSAADQLKSKLFDEINKIPKTDSDRPSGTDWLNYKLYAEAFAKIILNYETSTPITVGIYGQWGQGKSFLMGKIKEALRDKRKEKPRFSKEWKKLNLQQKLEKINSTLFNPAKIAEFFQRLITQVGGFFRGIPARIVDSATMLTNPKDMAKRYDDWRAVRKKARAETVDFHVVEFNAWAYVGTDHLWAGLVTRLYEEAEKYFGLRLIIARLWRAIKRSLPKSLIIFAFYALLGLGISLVINAGEIDTSLGDLTTAVKAFGTALLGGAGLAALPTLWTTMKDFFDKLFLTRSKSLENLTAKPDFKAQIGVMADIKSEIRFIGKLLRNGKQGHPTRFVLFIDDLDRCQHTKAVEVLQAIMLLLTDEDGAPFVIFLGLDARVLVRAIEQTYGDMLVKAGINGYEYLDKIVQVPFVIPPSSKPDIKSYVESMLWASDQEKLEVNRWIPPSPAATTPSGQGTNTASASGTGAAPAAVPDAGGSTPPAEVSPVGGSTPAPIPAAPPLEKVPVSFTGPERDVLTKCADDLVENPRKIKRIINIYRFIRQLFPSTMDREKAIHWVLLTEQWPYHLAWVLEDIENDEQTKKDELKEKNILDVYKRVKGNIYSSEDEMRKLLCIDADPDLFEQFIKKEPVFTVQEIKNFLPYTFNLNPAIRSEVCKQAIRSAETKPQPEKKTTTRKASTRSKSTAA